MWPWIASGNIVPMLYPLLCASFAIKNYDYGQDFCFYHKTLKRALRENSCSMGEHGCLPELHKYVWPSVIAWVWIFFYNCKIYKYTLTVIYKLLTTIKFTDLSITLPLPIWLMASFSPFRIFKKFCAITSLKYRANNHKSIRWHDRKKYD